MHTSAQLVAHNRWAPPWDLSEVDPVVEELKETAINLGKKFQSDFHKRSTDDGLVGMILAR